MGLDCSRAIIDQDHAASLCRDAVAIMLDQSPATQLRDELSVYTKAQVDSLLAGKANAGYTHGLSLYTGTAGDPAHEHLVQATTGIEQ